MRKCKYCGTAHIFEKKSCPAYVKTCDKCGNPNHFMSQCMSRSENGIRKQRATNYSKRSTRGARVHHVVEDDDDINSSESEWCNVLTQHGRQKKKEEVHFQIDTG